MHIKARILCVHVTSFLCLFVLIGTLFSYVLAESPTSSVEPPHTSEPIGFIRSAFKDVRLCRSSETTGRQTCKQAKPGDTLYPNSHIRTGDHGRARIAYADDERGDPEYISIREDDGAFVRYKREETGRFSTVYVGTGTNLSLHRFAKEQAEWRKVEEESAREYFQREWEQSTWSPFAGKRSAVWLLMRRSPTMQRFMKHVNDSAAFKVRTGTSVCGGRGTDYIYQKDPKTGEQMVAVLDGAVACAPAGQPETEIPPGSKLVVNENGSKLSPLTDEDKAAILENSELPDGADILSDKDWLAKSEALLIAGVEAAFARAEAEIQRAQPKLEAEQNACVAAVKAHWAGRSESERDRLKARLDEADRSFLADEVQDVAAKARDLQQKLHELESIVRRTGEKAASASEEACIAAKASSPDAGKSKAQAQRARNLVRLAAETRGRTMDQLRAEIDAIRPDDTLRGTLEQRLEDRLASIQAKSREQQPVCSLPNPSPHPWAASDRNGWSLKRAADKATSEAVSFMWSAKDTGLIGEADYRRLHRRERAARRALDPSRWYLCHSVHKAARKECWDTVVQGVKGRAGPVEDDGRQDVIDDMITRRTEWVEKLAAMADDIDARLESARNNAEKAASCASEAEAASGTVANVCSNAESYYRTGRKHYENGDAAAYRSSLQQAKAALGNAKQGACGGLASKITEGQEQARIFEEVNAEAGQLLSSCNSDDPRTRAAQMRKLSNLLSKSSQPYVQKLKRRLDAAQRVAVAYADTKDAFRDADLGRADRLLGGAQAALGNVGAQDCPDLRSALAKAPKVIDHWRDKVEAVDRFSNDCDMPAMRRYQSSLVKMDSPIASTLVARVKMALTDCERRKQPPTKEEAIATCRRQAVANGEVYAKTEIRDDGRVICHTCEPGQVYEDGKCGTVAAHNEAKCRQLAASKGKVYAATRVLPNGRLNCRWCEPGQTYHNGKCWTPQAYAEAKCQQDAARRGKVYARTVVHANGQYQCHWCEPGQYYAKGQCYSRQQTQPTYRRTKPVTRPPARKRIRPPTLVPVNPRL